MARPSPMLTNHSGRAAEVNCTPALARAVPATEPHSATPILTPTCREVDVTADAAPARSWGMPLTAALVIGALTIPKPMPYTVKITSSAHTGVVGVRNVSITEAAVIRMPEASSDGRLPYRPTSRPDSGEKNRAPMAIGR